MELGYMISLFGPEGHMFSSTPWWPLRMNLIGLKCFTQTSWLHKLDSCWWYMQSPFSGHQPTAASLEMHFDFVLGSQWCSLWVLWVPGLSWSFSSRSHLPAHSSTFLLQSDPLQHFSITTVTTPIFEFPVLLSRSLGFSFPDAQVTYIPNSKITF